MSPFGLLLRFYRNERGMAQKTIAARVGLSEKSLSAIETGRHQPPGEDILKKICDALDLRESEVRALKDAAAHSSPALRIPFGVTPRAYRLAHILLGRLNSLSVKQIEEIHTVLEQLPRGHAPREGNR